MKIRLRWSSGEITATLEPTPTTEKLLRALPLSAHANTWGQEVYFEIPVEAVLEEDARQVVDPGTVCFWVEGRSLALPYGPTPISVGDECRLVTQVNVLGRLDGDPSILASIGAGDTVEVVQAEGSVDA